MPVVSIKLGSGRNIWRSKRSKSWSDVQKFKWLAALLPVVVVSLSAACISYGFSSLHILRNSSGRHSVLMLLFMSNVTNLTLTFEPLFGFCATCIKKKCKCIKKCQGCDEGLLKFKPCWSCLIKGRYSSLPKKRTCEGSLRKQVSWRSKSSRKGKGERRSSLKVRRAQNVGRCVCCRQ